MQLEKEVHQEIGMLEEKRQRIMLKTFFRKLVRDRLAAIGLVLIFIQVIMALFPAYLAPHDPTKMNWGEEYAPPSSKYILGTDNMGRDVLSRVIWGTRTSLTVGIAAVAISATIGVTVGMISGFFGGHIDNLTMRITDTIMTLPSLLMLIVFSSIFASRSITITIIAIGALGWPGITRITRSRVLSVKNELFVEAARGVGASIPSLLFRHILPSCMAPIIVSVTMSIPRVMITEASLSFLGLGDPRIISWGGMLAGGRNVLRVAWWVAFFPGLAIFIIMLAFNFFGDGLRDALDVRQG
jgi:peptide/nickel transport system permease protein